MNQRDIVLAALAAGGRAMYSPVQTQKLMFLIDRQIAQHVDGPHFKHEPYDYGPFDHQVYRALEQLSNESLVEITTPPGYKFRRYRLTEAGQQQGGQILQALPNEARDFMQRASNFVRKLPFEALVASIYKAYPEMRANSIFQP